MKKLIALMLVLILAMGLVACSEEAQTETTDVIEEVGDEPIEEAPIGEEVTEEDFSDVDYSNDLPIILDDGTILNPDGTVSEEAPVEDEIVEDNAAETATMAVLQNIWALYGDDEKFAIMGGNPEAAVMDAPGAWDLAYAEGLAAALVIPADQMANVTEAATMIHMMNANNFSGGVLMLTEGTDVTAFAQAVRDAIQSNQWLCGMPEKLIVADLGNGCVLVAYGVNDAMTPFEAKLTTACADAQILFNEAIAG